MNTRLRIAKAISSLKRRIDINAVTSFKKDTRKFFIQKIESSWMLLLFLMSLSFVWNVTLSGENQFSILSEQILKGRLYLPEAVGDAVLHDGKYFWPLGPFPSIVLVPLSIVTLRIFSQPMPQGVVNVLLIVWIVRLVYEIGLKYGFSKESARWIAIAAVYASVFSLSAFLPWGWYFCHSITFLLGLLAFCEHLKKNNTLLIGIYHGLMFMTRFTAGLGILFYLMTVIFSKTSLTSKLRKCLLLIFPVLLAGVFLLFYNHVRFGSPFNNGYVGANNWVSSADTFKYELLKYGLFDVRNIPTNLYYYFINVPSPVLEKSEDFHRKIFKTDHAMIIHLVFPYVRVESPGVGFFVVSPLFLLVFRKGLRTMTSGFAALNVVFILIFLLMYYWTGWTQVGPRYMIDALPFVLILLLESYVSKGVTVRQKILITSSAVFNVFLFTSLFFGVD